MHRLRRTTTTSRRKILQVPSGLSSTSFRKKGSSEQIMLQTRTKVFPLTAAGTPRALEVVKYSGAAPLVSCVPVWPEDIPEPEELKG